MKANHPSLDADLRARHFWLLVGWALVLAVVYESVTPAPLEIGVTQGDKISHVLAYGTLMVWFANLYLNAGRRLIFAAGFVAMGVALEFVQRWLGYRLFEVADMLADAAGVAAGWALAPPRLPNILRGVERVFLSFL